MTSQQCTLSKILPWNDGILGMQATCFKKLKSLADLKSERDRLRSSGKKVVFTNGCFDLLHPGHTRYLEAARGLGHFLIVGVNSDRSVRAIKGAPRPIQAQ
jgi:cytidyltransferase-like protein